MLSCDLDDDCGQGAYGFSFALLAGFYIKNFNRLEGENRKDLTVAGYPPSRCCPPDSYRRFGDFKNSLLLVSHRRID